MKLKKEHEKATMYFPDGRVVLLETATKKELEELYKISPSHFEKGSKKESKK